jgi:hypothetical protein
VASSSQLVDPYVAWAAVIGPFVVGLVGAFVAWLKRNDPLLPPPAPVVPAPSSTTPASADPALLAVQDANARLLAMTERHIQTADERTAEYARENGELRRENADLRERAADLRLRLGAAEKEVVTLTGKVEVLQIRLDERSSRG